MVETRDGPTNIEVIAASPGLDGILVGVADLSAALGVPGELTHPSVRTVFRECVKACRQYGKFAGFGGVTGSSAISEYLAEGMQFAITGSDLGLMMAGVAAPIGTLRSAASTHAKQLAPT